MKSYQYDGWSKQKSAADLEHSRPPKNYASHSNASGNRLMARKRTTDITNTKSSKAVWKRLGEEATTLVADQRKIAVDVAFVAW